MYGEYVVIQAALSVQLRNLNNLLAAALPGALAGLLVQWTV